MESYGWSFGLVPFCLSKTSDFRHFPGTVSVSIGLLLSRVSRLSRLSKVRVGIRVSVITGYR